MVSPHGLSGIVLHLGWVENRRHRFTILPIEKVTKTLHDHLPLRGLDPSANLGKVFFSKVKAGCSPGLRERDPPPWLARGRVLEKAFIVVATVGPIFDSGHQK